MAFFLCVCVEMSQGFCVKCREKRDMVDPEIIVNKRGVQMMQAKCQVCGRKVNTFIKGAKKAGVYILDASSNDAPKESLVVRPVRSSHREAEGGKGQHGRAQASLLSRKRKQSRNGRGSKANRALLAPEEGVFENVEVCDDEGGE